MIYHKRVNVLILELIIDASRGEFGSCKIIIVNLVEQMHTLIWVII